MTARLLWASRKLGLPGEAAGDKDALRRGPGQQDRGVSRGTGLFSGTVTRHWRTLDANMLNGDTEGGGNRRSARVRAGWRMCSVWIALETTPNTGRSSLPRRGRAPPGAAQTSPRAARSPFSRGRLRGSHAPRAPTGLRGSPPWSRAPLSRRGDWRKRRGARRLAVQAAPPGTPRPARLGRAAAPPAGRRQCTTLTGGPLRTYLRTSH